MVVMPLILVGMVSWTGYVGGQVAHGTAVVQAGTATGETGMESREGEEGEGDRGLFPGEGEHEETDDD